MNKENYYKYIDLLSFTNELNKDLYSQHVSNIEFSCLISTILSSTKKKHR